MNGQKMAVDPNNPNVVYVGTPQNGLFVTTDGGVSWQKVSAVPVSATDTSGQYPGITGITFDPTSGVTGGKTNTIFASSYGHGVYESTNGGAVMDGIERRAERCRIRHRFDAPASTMRSATTIPRSGAI